MSVVGEFFGSLGEFVPIFTIFVLILIIYCLYRLIANPIRKRILKKVRTKSHISDVDIFFKVLNIIVLFTLVLFGIFSYAGSWTGFGISLGLFTAALGWALQKPIAGFAAWIMVITKRPFQINDRIVIGDVKGDVVDITPTHIYLKEVGGLIETENRTGRTIMIPNHTLFDLNIINYSFDDDFVLGQVVVSVTYESNLDKALKICLESTQEHTTEGSKETGNEPFARISLEDSGVAIKTRYYVSYNKMQRTSTAIRKEIYDRIKKTRGVEIAYPHTEVIYRKK